MALALAAALAMLDPNRWRGGSIAGMVVAVWLTISLEGLPMASAVLALAALRWALTPQEAPLLRASATSAAAVTLALFVVTQRIATWWMPVCDAVSAPYLAALGVAALGTAGVTYLPLHSAVARLVALAVAGLATLAVIPAVMPACAAGPFAQLDPVVHDFW